jgi:FkbM family methyltransferase
MSLNFSTRAIGAIESLIGRRALWRLGRLIYRHARRDGNNKPEINGEYALHRKLASWASRRSEPFNVIDVGANIGYWSSHLLDECQRAGVQSVRLWAFEPSEEIRVQLASRLQSPPPDYRVAIRREAVSDTRGQAAFDATPGIVGIKHLLTDAMVADGEMLSVDVTVTTLPPWVTLSQQTSRRERLDFSTLEPVFPSRPTSEDHIPIRNLSGISFRGREDAEIERTSVSDPWLDGSRQRWLDLPRQHLAPSF